MLLLMGGLIYWKMGGSDPKPTAPPPPVASVAPVFEEPPPPPPPPEEEPKDAGVAPKQAGKRVASTSGGCGGECKGEAPGNLRATLSGKGAQARGCYERALLKEPGLAGKVVLEWTISTGGTVVSAKTKSSTLRNGEVEGCILRNLKTWKFPPAKGGVVIVSYPFLFNSVGY